MNKDLSLFLAAGTSHSAQDAGLDRAALLRAETQQCEGPCQESPGKSGLRPDAFAALRDSCEHVSAQTQTLIITKKGSDFHRGVGFPPWQAQAPQFVCRENIRKVKFHPCC